MGKRTPVTRRNALKSTGLAAVSLASVAGSAKKLPDPVSIRRSEGNPASYDEVLRARRRYIREWRRRVGPNRSLPEFITLTTPRGDTTARSVFAYDFELLSDGTPVEWVGTVERAPVDTAGTTAKSSSLVAEAHERTGRQFAALRDTRTATVGTSDVDTQATDRWTEWLNRGSSGDTMILEPYGTWQFQIDHVASPDDTTVHAIKSHLEQQAGKNKDWNSPWENDRNTVRHNYDRSYDNVNADIVSHRPKNDFSQSVSTSLTLSFDSSGPSLAVEYSYSQPAADVIDESRTHEEDKGRWEMTIAKHSIPAETNTYYTPASMAKIQGSDYRYSDVICLVEATAYWKDYSPLFGSNSHHDHRGFYLWIDSS